MDFKVFFVVFATLFFASCRPANDDDEVPPAYILNEQTFIKVLADCYLGEGAAGINVKNVTGEKFDSAYVFNPFMDNGITKQQFDTTIVYYSGHPLKLKAIYNKLLDQLSQIQAVGSLGRKTTSDKSRYAGQDARFFFTTSKMDSIENSTVRLGYCKTFPYRP